MTETTHAQPAHSGHNCSAVGRLVVLVEVAGGAEKVTYKRRLRDASAARQWCEEKVRRASEGTEVLEIQVTEEVWARRHA